MARILALDLGQFKTVACAFAPPAEPAFTTTSTTTDHLAALIRREAPDLVVCETGCQAGWVHDLCATLGVRCAVANPNGEARRWRNLKRKTDRDDAPKLARLAAAGELPTVHVPASAERPARRLIRFRQSVVARRVAIQNRIRARVDAQGLTMAAGAKAWNKVGLARLDGWARPLDACGPLDLWRGERHLLLDERRRVRLAERDVDAVLDRLAAADERVRRVRTIPGVGRVTAEVVVNFPGDGTRFDTAGQVGSDAGLAPRPHQSGRTDRRGRVTNRGPGLLRRVLVEAGWRMVRRNRWARRRGGSRRSSPWRGRCS